MPTQNTISQNRQYHLDYLRFFAALAIILLHVSAQNISDVELHSTEWSIYNFSMEPPVGVSPFF